MSSLNALKYKIEVKPSYYAGAVALLLYLFVLLLSLSVVTLSIFSLLIYLLLFLIALYACKQSLVSQGELLISESGVVEWSANNRRFHGKMSLGCIYCGFFICLHLQSNDEIGIGEKSKYLLIYKDAVSVEQFRLLARVINSRRG